MKSPVAVVLLLLACIALSSAWSTEDYEIFRLRDEVALSEGENATFYSFIGVKPSASVDEINKAYRKQSRNLHPDKARQSFVAGYSIPKPSAKPKSGKKPGVNVHKNKQPSQREISAFNKEASARFARLGVVANILRGEDRDRYDHFLTNGFPRWRGTGYYYQRFRPGLGAVLTGLFVVVGGGAHYLALYLSWKRQREFVERYIKHARRMAWGDDSSLNNIPGISANGGTSTPTQQDSEMEEPAQPWNRREKRAKQKEDKRANKNPKAARAAEKAKTSGISTPVEVEMTSGPVGAKKRTVAENGKVLIVDSVGNVYLEEEAEDGQRAEFLLDVDEIAAPTISDTVLFRLPKYIYNQTAGRVMGKTEDAEVAELLGEDATTDESLLEQATSQNRNAETRKRKVRVKPHNAAVP